MSDGTKIVNFGSIMRSILVIRLSSLGDVILSTPVVRMLRRTYPLARIDVLVSERFSEVWANNPHVDTLWKMPTPDSLAVATDELKLSMLASLEGSGSRKYDLVLDLQNSLRSTTFHRGLGIRTASAPKHRLEKLALVWLKRKPNKVVHVVDRYRQSISDLPLSFDTSGPEVWLPDEQHSGAYLDRRLDIRRQTIGIAPGAHHATKRWTVAGFATVARYVVEQLGLQVMLIGGHADVELCEAVESTAGVPIQRAYGSASIIESAQRLDTCAALITNDTGVMHLASARRVPTVAIFGSTVVELGFTPYGVAHKIVEHDVACRPCSHIGRASCPKGHFLCMNSITPMMVVRALEQLL